MWKLNLKRYLKCYTVTNDKCCKNDGDIISFYNLIFMFKTSLKQKAHGLWFAHQIKTAIAYLQMPCNILPVLPQQLEQKFDHDVKRSKVILRLPFEQIW